MAFQLLILLPILGKVFYSPIAGENKTFKRLLESQMDFSVDPCMDFYNFTCGNFLKTTEIPDDKPFVGTIPTVVTKRDKKLFELLNQNETKNEIAAFKKAKRIFRACMDERKIETLGLQPMKKFIKNFNNSWPQKNENSLQNFDWKNVVKQIRSKGIASSALINFYVTTDFNNASRRIIAIDQAETGVARDILLEGKQNKVVQAYLDFIANVSKVLDEKIDEKQSRRIAEEIIDFEIALAGISASRESRRDSNTMNYHRTIRQLNEDYPYLDWLEYIKVQIGGKVKIDENELVLVIDRNYTAALGPLLEKSSKKVIFNYQIWSLIRGMIKYSNKDLRDIALQYKKAAIGIKKEKERWEICALNTFDELSHAVSSMYVRAYFDQQSKRAVSDVLEKIRIEFKEHLTKNVNWMDPVTRGKALKKLEKLKASVAFPDEYLNDKIIDKEYKSLKVDHEDYFEVALRLSKFILDKQFDRFREAINKNDWRTLQPAAMVNAFYDPSLNRIELLAGILQDKFFDKNHPNYMNYGSIGMVMGHEIGHAFDDEGSQYDSEGNLHDWWDNSTRMEYENRTQCMIDQYGSFMEPQTGLKINGQISVGENVADIFGLRTAYRAYRKIHTLDRNLKLGPKKRVFTPEQLFWISNGQMWCTKRTRESMEIQIKTGIHTPARYRVNGPLINLDEFATDFQCSVKENSMNPKKKCTVW